MLKYENFDLEITRAEPGVYRAHVASSPAGEADATFVLPFDDEQLENFVQNLRVDVLACDDVRTGSRA